MTPAAEALSIRGVAGGAWLCTRAENDLLVSDGVLTVGSR